MVWLAPGSGPALRNALQPFGVALWPALPCSATSWLGCPPGVPGKCGGSASGSAAGGVFGLGDVDEAEEVATLVVEPGWSELVALHPFPDGGR